MKRFSSIYVFLFTFLQATLAIASGGSEMFFLGLLVLPIYFLIVNSLIVNIFRFAYKKKGINVTAKDNFLSFLMSVSLAFIFNTFIGLSIVGLSKIGFTLKFSLFPEFLLFPLVTTIFFIVITSMNFRKNKNP